MTASQDFLLMDNPFTILLGRPPSVNTLWYMLVVLPKLILLLLWTKFVFSAVESQLVSFRSISISLCNMIICFFLLLVQIDFRRSWCYLECCKTKKGFNSSYFWNGGCWPSCESLLSCKTGSSFGVALFEFFVASANEKSVFSHD